MTNSMIINLVKINNTFLYKPKEFLRNKNNKLIINFDELNDFSVDKYDIELKRILIGSLIIKKLKKIIQKNNTKTIEIYYIIENLDIQTINSIEANVNSIKKIDIEFNLYTDELIDSFYKINNIYKLSDLKDDKSGELIETW